MTEAASKLGLKAPRAIFAVALRWDAEAGHRIGRYRIRLSRTMTPVPSEDPQVAAWTLAVPADDRRAWRRALGAACRLGGQDLGTRVALSWCALDAAGAEAEDLALAGAHTLLDRVRAANRHGIFADAQAYAHLGVPAAHFGDYGWRLRSPRLHLLRWLSGLATVAVCTVSGAAFLPCLYPKSEGIDARLWVSVEDANGQKRAGCAIQAGDHVGMHLLARPAAYGTVLVLSPDGRWTMPHNRLADVVWSARAPEASGWFAVEAGAGQECLYAVSSPTPLGDGRGLESRLNAAAATPALPESPWLRPAYGAAGLRAALAILAPGAEVFEATCALSYGR